MKREKVLASLGLNLMLFGLYILPRVDFQSDSILKWLINNLAMVQVVLMLVLGYHLLKDKKGQ
ncbi:hypothetical protein [Streptococcus ovis]|uniref:hypothetical protein n=1 Tax=Streptococcus ovis TaxID=82806 RepID=UPI000367F0C3|nr:hypothetical protein [Streptococcus ovis]